MELSVFQTLYNKGKEIGLPVDVWYPIVMHESGGDPKSIGDNGTSYGLLQIHAPAHPGFDITKYTDPAYQADFYFPELKRVYDEGLSKGLTGADLTVYVERYGERPKWTDSIATSITKHYNTLMNVSLNPGAGMLTPPGLGSAASTIPDTTQAVEDVATSIPDTIKDLAYKAAFFIPALILIALGVYMLFSGSIGDIKGKVIKQMAGGMSE